ncbi:MAG: class I SAM-dependent methyltransferase, partial [Actinomycetota bacterium]
MSDRSAFAGGDQSYLRDVQYRDGTNLDIRAALHDRFSTSPIGFVEFAAGLIDWSPDLDVLECGTGTGRFWDNTSTPRSVSLTLTDLSPGMIQTSVRRATENGFDRVVSQECDIQDLPFPDDSFDLAVANHMLYHAPDPDLAVAELARVLRPEGTLLAATNGSGQNEAIAEVFGSHGGGLFQVFGIDTGEARLR